MDSVSLAKLLMVINTVQEVYNEIFLGTIYFSAHTILGNLCNIFIVSHQQINIYYFHVVFQYNILHLHPLGKGGGGGGGYID